MDQAFLNRLLEVIDANIGNHNFCVKDLAHEMGMSHTSLLRKVKSLTDRSINQLIRETRLTKALEILQTEKVNVSEVAYMLGFSSPSYFSTCFHKHFGYSPGEVAKKELDSHLESNNRISANFEESREKPARSRLAIISGFLVVLIVTVILISIGATERYRHAKSIAVLPFRLMVDEDDKNYLSDGMKEAIVLQLSRISELKVIPSLSTEQYQNKDKTIMAIGHEMNVKYILYGSFHKFRDTVRLRIMLYIAESEGLVWENEYSENWENIFSIQNNVAQDIAREIGVALSPSDLMSLATPPTSDITAYDFYLKGLEYQKRSYNESDRQYAKLMFQKAVDIDPDFALAWAGLASCHRQTYWFVSYGRNEIRSLAKQHLEKAMALSPDSKEIRIEEALYYYQCHRDYLKSMDILEELKSDFPNDSWIRLCIGRIYRRMGEYRKALKNFEKAISLNPADWEYWSSKAETARAYGDYLQAENSMKKALDLNPSFKGGYKFLCGMYIYSGQLSRASEYMKTQKDFFNPDNLMIYHAIIESWARNYEKAIEWTESRADGPLATQNRYCSKYLDLALIYRLIPDTTKASYYFKKERDLLLNLINEVGSDYRLFYSLGIAYAGLGMKAEAIEAGQKALEINNIHIDHYGGYIAEIWVVRILIMVEEYQKALEKLDLILSKNSVNTSEFFKRDPFWDPVRNHPKFIEIINNPKYRSDLADQ